MLAEGALQPVINLLSSPCSESQREAALLLGQFATTDNGEEQLRLQLLAAALLPESRHLCLPGGCLPLPTVLPAGYLFRLLTPGTIP